MGVVVRTATDLGLKRSQNEDSHGTWMPAEPAERARRGVLLVVADGMGGSRAGEVASRLAVQTVLRTYREAPGENPLEDLYRAIEAANQIVHRESTTRPDLAGMGTTCTAVVVRESDAYIGHVGDSRAYHIHNGQIRQLTRDHSLVAQLVRDGQLTPEQARVDPRRNVVTRSVGVGATVEIDADHEPGLLTLGDTLLLCSDGLHGLVADDELKAAGSDTDLEQGCRRAIALANERGGPDNITVVLARVAPQDDPGPGAAPGGEQAAARQNGGEPSGERAGSKPDPPRPYALREERRASSSAMLMWLIMALTVLLLAVAGMAFVLHRMGKTSRGLGVHDARPAGEMKLAWR
jgi:protein phosphatase